MLSALAVTPPAGVSPARRVVPLRVARTTANRVGTATARGRRAEVRLRTRLHGQRHLPAVDTGSDVAATRWQLRGIAVGPEVGDERQRDRAGEATGRCLRSRRRGQLVVRAVVPEAVGEPLLRGWLDRARIAEPALPEAVRERRRGSTGCMLELEPVSLPWRLLRTLLLHRLVAEDKVHLWKVGNGRKRLTWLTS